MSLPQDLMYTKDHEWVKMEGDTATIGITDYAQKSMGDIVFINMPQEGDSFKAGDSLCDVESVKAVSDVFSPISGTVAAINEELLDAPEKLNQDPYGAWLVKLSGISDTGELISAADYEALCGEE